MPIEAASPTLLQSRALQGHLERPSGILQCHLSNDIAEEERTQYLAVGIGVLQEGGIQDESKEEMSSW